MQQHLEELSVQQLIEKHNFVIPEIQREYVWGNNDHNILGKFFNDIKEGFRQRATSANDKVTIAAIESVLEKADDSEKDALVKILERYKKDMNIGFLYSYKPDYYLPGDRGEDAYLIDGQQRFTTLFLALFYFSLKEVGNREDFLQTFRFNPKLDRLAFDYRVRSISHQFLLELISNCKNLEDLSLVTNSTWFLSGFSNDVTVKSMIKTLEKLNETFGDESSDYYQFIKKQIKFWHFKTEETSQGEELYITMNSRGQQLAENETIRATLFDTDLVKSSQLIWGAKWEKWQDFFWQYRDKGGNADFGLNQFLRWVNVIENITKIKHINREAAEKSYKVLIAENRVLDYVGLLDIEQYFNSLEKLVELQKQGHFEEDAFKGSFSLEWLKKAPKQGDLIVLFPALIFLTKCTDIYKLVRFVRYFSNAAKGADISRNPDTFIVESILLSKAFIEASYTDVVDLVEFTAQFPRLIPSEEVWKLTQFRNAKDENNRLKIESVFWQAEDHDVFKGKIGHLIQASFYEGSTSEFIYDRAKKYITLGKVNVERFNEIFESYKEIYKNAAVVWGDLIVSGIYTKQVDRLVEAPLWQLHDAFFRFVLLRNRYSTITLIAFLIKIEKEYILSYTTEEQLQSETDPSKQLYIYYILLSRVLHKWDWKNKWNFGIYQGIEYPNAVSLFSTKYVYQFYNTQWRYNVGYEVGSGIWLQDNFDYERNYFEELLKWARAGVPVLPTAATDIDEAR